MLRGAVNSGIYVPDLRVGPGSVRGTSALGCRFNWSMQHLNSHYREEDIENEVLDEDLLRRNRQSMDVESLVFSTD